MQNFTLGKKGFSMLLFALILLTGSLPSFGQNCPTVTNTTPDEFCYLSTLADLTAAAGAEANGDDLRWYRNATSNTPIPNNELLQDGSYFAGNQSGTCTSRIEVTVVVDDYPAPTTPFGNTFTECIYTGEDDKTVADLIAVVEGNQVQIFADEFGEEPLDPATELVPQTSYFAGQINPDNGCPSRRIDLRYDPIYTQAPTGDAEQVFCAGATVADLQATGTDESLTTAIRWYSTATSNPALDPSTPLVDGETYYASQVMNRVGSPIPPCESRARLEVTVTVGDPSAGENNTGNEICRNTLPATITETTVRNYFTGLLSADATPGGTFSGMTIAEITEDFNTRTDFPVTYTTVYTVGEGLACEDTATLSVTIQPAPDAGEDNTDTVFCRAELPDTITEEFVEDLFRDLLDPEAETGGTFSPSFAEIAAALNEEGAAGTFSTTYTVTEGDCPDTAELAVTVEIITAGADNTDNQLCRANLAETLTEAQVRNYFLGLLSPDATPGGTFSDDSIAEITAAFNTNTTYPATYSTTYTVGEGDCVDTAQLAVTVNESPNAGPDVTETICITDVQEILENLNPFNPQPTLEALLAEIGWEGDTSGTFNPSPNVLAGQLAAYLANEEDRAEFLLLEGTYTVGAEGPCPDQATFAITILDTRDAYAGEIADQTVCAADGLIDLTTFLEGSGAIRGGTFTGANVENGFFDASVGPNEGGYEITYTVDSSAECVSEDSEDDSETFTITVEPAPVAGQINQTFCFTEAQEFIENPTDAYDFFVSLVEDLGVTVDPAQFEEGAMDEATRMFNFIQQPDADSETFTTSYTVPSDNETCEEGVVEISITINNLQEAEAGDIQDQEICSNDEPLDLTTLLTNSSLGGTFSFESTGEVIADATLDPSTLTAGTTYTIVYSVDDEGLCVIEGTSDSTTFDIEVFAAPEVGEPNSITYCVSEIDAEFEAGITFEELFLDLLDTNVSTEGSFETTPVYDGPGTYEVNYTLSNEAGCEESVLLTINVEEVTAGDDNLDAELCRNTIAATVTEATVRNYFLGLLSDDATAGGTFDDDSIAEITAAFNANTTYPATFSTTYTVGEGICQDTADLAVTILGAPNAGPDNLDTEICRSDLPDTLTEDNVEELFLNLLGADATTGGTFTPSIADLTTAMNNATTTTTFTTTYRVTEGQCPDTADLAITIAISDAPVAEAEQTFCLGDNPTVADLEATGETVVWYTDAELTNEAASTRTLTDGEVYYAVEEGENACGRPSTAVTVNLIDSLAPTLPALGNEFCRQDNPTVQDLIDNLSGSNIQIYSSATGGAPLAATTSLENNTTYYATATDQSACESSERLPINVEVGFCGIPEGFSPNGDNVNDTFEIPNIRRDYPNYNIEIYNRWGNLVYRGNEDWDGVSNQSTTLGDKVLPAGVYFYILNYNDGQTNPVQGKVYLSR